MQVVLESDESLEGIGFDKYARTGGEE